MADAPGVLDALELAEGKRLSVVADADGLAALPMIRDPVGHWRRAEPGDGVAEALLARLAAVDGWATAGRFTLRSWAHRTATGERPMGVDQTNESVIVGDAAVVKWATHLQDGPHPAARRIGVLRDAGFGGMPAPWGLVTWQPTAGAETLVANVDEYLPGAVDGWTWAVDLITEAARDHDPAPAVAAAIDAGTLVAEMHASLSGTAALATPQDAVRWRAGALEALETVRVLGDSASVVITRARRAELETILDGLGALAGTPVIEGHGDLHVGQVLKTNGRFVVTDFDGNPVLPATQRALPIPAALDVAGMTQSLAHAAIVARKYTTLDHAALADVDAECRAALLDAYTTRLAELGHAGLFDPSPLRAFRTQQVLREIIYATRHLPRWMYVPDAALPALLDEGIEP
ncbi:MAG: maltokinase [Mycobacterium sp.]|nr:maltokinase [Mycobacterium sp.]